MYIYICGLIFQTVVVENYLRNLSVGNNARTQCIIIYSYSYTMTIFDSKYAVTNLIALFRAVGCETEFI